ncbi:hypothetical protein J6590_089916 [Homalodisca vitripennis]|nr:hypothetical protein J6590_098669 [Homalodisca vitripennis]KAG8309276.1 hypothetical protein J6590_089916 [Homalodisca vitripennis]
MCLSKSKKRIQLVALSVIFSAIVLSLWIELTNVPRGEEPFYRSRLLNILPTGRLYSRVVGMGVHEVYFDERLKTKQDGEQNANLTITIISSESGEKIVDVKQSKAASNETKTVKPRDVFVKVKDIKKSTSNVFFVETKCATEKTAKMFNFNGEFVLNARQCCAIESTALANLDRTLYVFHSCPLTDNFIERSPKYVEKLFAYPNVYVVKLNNSEIFTGTPLQELYDKKQLETSYYPIEHTSDALRFTLLWRFGGTYCDLDVVTIKSLHGLGSNWAGMQDVRTIASGVLNFEPTGPGHEMVQRALQHMNRHFNGAGWSNNGPMLITRTALQECKVPSVTKAVAECKGNFTVHPNYIFYPVYYSRAFDLFDDHLGKEIVRSAKLWAYSVHIWNKLSHDKKCRVGSTQAYSLLAEEFCPRVYRNCGTRF